MGNNGYDEVDFFELMNGDKVHKTLAGEKNRYAQEKNTPTHIQHMLYGIVENDLLMMMLFILTDCLVFMEINTMNWEKS